MPLQVVVGATAAKQLGLALGNTFAGAHGLGAGGHTHGDSLFTVDGILEPSGSVLDRLILTDTASVRKVHADHTAHAAHDDHDEDGDAEDQPVAYDAREITKALESYKTPLAAMSFQRYFNTQTEVQAAAPAVEISRLLNLLGLGTEVLRAFAGVLLLTAALSVFIALWSAVRERRGDPALLRMLGAPPYKVEALLLCEASWLCLLSAVAGLSLGQAFAATLAWALQLDHSLLIGGMVWPAALWLVPAIALRWYRWERPCCRPGAPTASAFWNCFNHGETHEKIFIKRLRAAVPAGGWWCSLGAGPSSLGRCAHGRGGRGTQPQQPLCALAGPRRRAALVGADHG